MMKIFKPGDIVYVVTPGYLVEVSLRLEANEPLKVVFDHFECGLAYVTDLVGSSWEIPNSVICGVPEGHIFDADLGTTPEPNPCVVCGCAPLVPCKGKAWEEPI
jgi:hypothetical protein